MHTVRLLTFKIFRCFVSLGDNPERIRNTDTPRRTQSTCLIFFKNQSSIQLLLVYRGKDDSVT